MMDEKEGALWWVLVCVGGYKGMGYVMGVDVEWVLMRRLEGFV